MLWTGKASILTAETTEGEIGVLPGHEAMIGQLVENGVVTFRPVDEERRFAAVQGGFLSVTDEKVTVLADWAVWADEVDSSRAQEDAKSDDQILQSRGEAGLRALRRSQEK